MSSGEEEGTAEVSPPPPLYLIIICALTLYIASFTFLLIGGAFMSRKCACKCCRVLSPIVELLQSERRRRRRPQTEQLTPYETELLQVKLFLPVEKKYILTDAFRVL